MTFLYLTTYYLSGYHILAFFILGLFIYAGYKVWWFITHPTFMSLLKIYVKYLEWGLVSLTLSKMLVNNCIYYKSDLGNHLGLTAQSSDLVSNSNKISIKVESHTPLKITYFMVCIYLLLRFNDVFKSFAVRKSLITIGSFESGEQRNLGPQFLWRDDAIPSLDEWMTHFLPSNPWGREKFTIMWDIQCLN
uniref:Uncharacterized protein n=1 Tax=Microbotryum lychnidis-dioicae TaxID=288795 RepID=M1GLW5_9BASI|nr:hypothetical protein H911_mgp21 [Microbotryum lychnidis-dioicae]AGE14597.1 hypothetical protein [Microbotryum lychnidis-dioicae]